MATDSSVLAWEIPWTEEPGGYSPWGCKELNTTEATEHTLKVQSMDLRQGYQNLDPGSITFQLCSNEKFT